ncbi:tetratricopeptide repeat protein [Microcoleus sp. BROC3]|uniref:tetratricopeptide repeat protein n=1 Tax=Microcoleus sp. BROC3 TaxID=3055323 RepID=UPI002FD2D826
MINYFEEANQLRQEGSLEEAIAYYNNAIEQNPDFYAYHQNLGEVLAKLGRWDEAVDAYQQALELNPNSVHSSQNLGEALAKLSRWDEAIACYQKNVDLAPEDYENHYNLAEALRQRTYLDCAKAIDVYQPVIQLNPELLEGYKKILQLQPKNWEVWFELGNQLANQNQKAEAIEAYNRVIELNPNFVEALSKLAEEMRRNNQLEKAIYYCKQIIKINPNSVENHFQLAKNLLLQGKRDEALRSYYRSNQIKLAEARNQGEIGTICLCILPKSGTVYIMNSLMDGLSLPPYSPEHLCVEGVWPDYYWKVQSSELFKKSVSCIMAANHTNANDWNLFTISMVVDRLVVNIRDPRQGLLSLIHYWDNLYSEMIDKGQDQASHYLISFSWFPENYFFMPLTDKITWHINNFYLPQAIKWIEGWLDAEANPSFYPKILFTRHEDLASNPQGFFEDILDFYEIEKSRFKFPQKPEFKQGTHHRKGRIDEWREVFTAEQAEKSSSMIPKRMLERFGWVER